LRRTLRSTTEVVAMSSTPGSSTPRWRHRRSSTLRLRHRRSSTLRLRHRRRRSSSRRRPRRRRSSTRRRPRHRRRRSSTRRCRRRPSSTRRCPRRRRSSTRRRPRRRPPRSIAPPRPPPPPAIAAPRPPPPMGPFRILGFGVDFLEASSDQGGNIWGASAATIYFFRGGAGDGLTFDQSNGLAHGQTTWTDTYWFGTDASPSIQPVSFTSVARGMAGQAFIGNVGFIGDRLEIDPASGAVQLLMSMEVTEVQQSDPTELFEQKKRETSTLHALVDLNGPQSGAVWFGGWH